VFLLSKSKRKASLLSSGEVNRNMPSHSSHSHDEDDDTGEETEKDLRKLPPEERKRAIRRMKNRESARKVRARRQQEITDLNAQIRLLQDESQGLRTHIAQLQGHIQALTGSLNATTAKYETVAAENMHLRAELHILRSRGPQRERTDSPQYMSTAPPQLPPAPPLLTAHQQASMPNRPPNFSSLDELDLGQLCAPGVMEALQDAGRARMQSATGSSMLHMLEARSNQKQSNSMVQVPQNFGPVLTLAPDRRASTNTGESHLSSQAAAQVSRQQQAVLQQLPSMQRLARTSSNANDGMLGMGHGGDGSSVGVESAVAHHDEEEGMFFGQTRRASDPATAQGRGLRSQSQQFLLQRNQALMVQHMNNGLPSFQFSAEPSYDASPAWPPGLLPLPMQPRQQISMTRSAPTGPAEMQFDGMAMDSCEARGWGNGASLNVPLVQAFAAGSGSMRENIDGSSAQLDLDTLKSPRMQQRLSTSNGLGGSAAGQAVAVVITSGASGGPATAHLSTGGHENSAGHLGASAQLQPLKGEDHRQDQDMVGLNSRSSSQHVGSRRHTGMNPHNNETDVQAEALGHTDVDIDGSWQGLGVTGM